MQTNKQTNIVMTQQHESKQTANTRNEQTNKHTYA